MKYLRALAQVAIFCLFIGVLYAYAITKTYTVSWTWGAGPHDGAKLYWGTGAGIYENSIDMGSLNVWVHEFDFGNASRVCFVARTYVGTSESPYSNEVCKDFALPTPTATPIAPPPSKPITLSIKE